MSRRHFVFGSYDPPKKIFYPEREYGRVLDGIVLSCVDSLVLDTEENVLLGYRVDAPPGWWMVGGRMLTGEDFEETAARKIRQELGLTLELNRFECLGPAYSFVLGKRVEPPRKNGTHRTSTVMVVRITGEEARAISPNKEYRQVAWRDPATIVGNEFYPALVKVAEDLRAFLVK